MTRRKFIFTGFLIAAGLSYFLLKPHPEIDFNYFSFGCQVFSTDGKIILNEPGSKCAFADDGTLLDISLHQKDKEKLVWHFTEPTHHDVRFSYDQKSFLILNAEMILLDGLLVKSDCVSRRDLQNSVLTKWCLGDHLQELREEGFVFTAKKTVPNYTLGDLKPEYEISHANTVFEIPENALALQNPAFAKGNYLVNFAGNAGVLVVLDSTMKNILWFRKMNEFRLDHSVLNRETHDNQLMPDGTILSFMTITSPDNRSRSYVVRWNPLEPYGVEHRWIWKSAELKNDDTPIAGEVTELKNGNYLIADMGNQGSQIFAVNKNGDTKWQFVFPNGMGGRKPLAIGAKPMYDTGFLRSRGLVDY